MDELKTDYRKASAEQVFAVKKQIVRLWKAGKKTDEIRDIKDFAQAGFKSLLAGWEEAKKVFNQERK